MIERSYVSYHPGEQSALLWRGALAVTTEPPEIFLHGVAMGLSPAETALMAMLVRRGRAAHRDIAEALAGAGASAASLDVITYRIRRKFAAAGAHDPIETRRNWGLVLRVEPDARGSTALWIGTAERRGGQFGDPSAWPAAAPMPVWEAERRF
jgi:DNA-binding response OmpR family regulator